MLVDSTAAVHRAWTQWAREVGVDVAGVLAVAHGRRTADTIRLVAPQRDAAAEAARIEEREIGQAQALRRYPGATALLGALPPGSWAVVTSGSRPLALSRLQATGLPVPATLVTGDDVTAGKPDPECYLAGAAGLSLAPPDCVVVEDAPAGVASGLAAGMRVVAVTTTHPAAALATADLILAGLGELRARTSASEIRLSPRVHLSRVHRPPASSSRRPRPK